MICSLRNLGAKSEIDEEQYSSIFKLNSCDLKVASDKNSLKYIFYPKDSNDLNMWLYIERYKKSINRFNGHVPEEKKLAYSCIEDYEGDKDYKYFIEVCLESQNENSIQRARELFYKTFLKGELDRLVLF